MKFPKNFFPVLFVNDDGVYICTNSGYFTSNLAYYIVDAGHLRSVGKGIHPFYSLNDRIDVQDLITHNHSAIQAMSDRDRAPLITPVPLSSTPIVENQKLASKEQTPVKHRHYHKDVSNLNFIDIYDILYLYNVTDPTIQHAIKKLLVPGGRGGNKDFEKDITEAIDSLVRGKELRAVHAKKDG